MKNRFNLLYIFLFATMAGLFLAACEEEGGGPLIAPSIAIEKLITATSNELVLIFTPSESAVKFVYAVGNESDLENFLTGSLPTIKEVTGNAGHKASIIDLNENQLYTIFARAYDASGTGGPVAIFKAKTRKPVNNYAVRQQYLTDNAVAYTITASNEYYKFDFALGRVDNIQTDKANFEAGIIDGFTTKEEISEYTANYFMLDADTEYVFLVRGYDRQSKQVSETMEYPFTTCKKGEAPSLSLAIEHIDLYCGDYIFTPNEHCGKFAVFLGLKDVYKMLIEEEFNWKGDIMRMMKTWTEANGGLTTVGEKMPLKTSFTTPAFITGEISDPYGYPIEAYALLYDEQGAPLAVQRFELKSPLYKEDVKTAEVKVRISNITGHGAFYEFFPNEYTLGFFYETFDAEWYEKLLQSGDYYDGYIEQYVYQNGYWSYCHQTPSTTFPERTAEPGKNYYIFVLPMNYNGPNGGWGKLLKVPYTTKEEIKEEIE